MYIVILVTILTLPPMAPFIVTTPWINNQLYIFYYYNIG
jgi:hypothetical protein